VTSASSSRAASGRATLLVALSACGFGAIAIFVTFAIEAGAPLLAVLTWRYVLAALILGPIAWYSTRVRMNRALLRVMLIAGFFQVFIAVVSLSALRYIPAGTLSFLFYMYPAFIAIIARLRHTEPLTPVRLLALGLSLFGIFVMVGAPGGTALHPVGVTLALVSAVLYAVYIPMIGAMQRDLSPVVTAACVAVGAAVILAVASATRGELRWDLPPTAWRAILGLSIISTAIAFLMFLRGLRVLGAVRTAIISTIEPFFTALLGALLLGQPLTPATLIGGLLIATAVVLLQLRPASNEAPVAEH
jgi:drug/metabolite transporter (DMT)-like permease